MSDDINKENLSWTECRVSAYGAHLSLNRLGRIELVDLLRAHLSANVELLDPLKNIQRQLGDPGFAVMRQPFDALTEMTTTHIEYLCARIKDFGGMPERALLASLRAPIQHTVDIPFADGLGNIHRRTEEMASFTRRIQPLNQRAQRYGDYATGTLITEILAQAQAIVQGVKLNVPASRGNSVPAALYQRAPVMAWQAAHA
jgi:DNA-binding ferritin-like protein